MSWLPMMVIPCRFSSGQRVPLLMQDGLAAPLPKLVPFIYVQLTLRHRAYNTAAAHLRAIQAFYTYAKSRELPLAHVNPSCTRLKKWNYLWFRGLPRRLGELPVDWVCDALREENEHYRL